jgi:hypothetical protein
MAEAIWAMFNPRGTYWFEAELPYHDIIREQERGLPAFSANTCSPPGDHKRDMEPISVVNALREFLRIRAFLIHVDIDVIEQFAVLAEYLRLHPGKPAHQIIETFAHGSTIHLDFCLLFRQMTQRLVYVYLYAHSA